MDERPPISPRSRIRWPLLLAGFAFVGLGTLGVFLPLLPTTPFLIVAAACFARSSERWYRWLVADRTFGPLIRDWEEHRCMPRAAKRASLLAMAGVGGFSLLFAVEGLWLRLGGGLFLATGMLVVLRIPTCRAERDE